MTAVLVLNAGSSSVRMSLVEVLAGQVERRAQRHFDGHLGSGFSAAATRAGGREGQSR